MPPHLELASMAAAADAHPQDVPFGDHPRLLELKKWVLICVKKKCVRV